MRQKTSCIESLFFPKKLSPVHTFYVESTLYLYSIESHRNFYRELSKYLHKKNFRYSSITGR